MIDAYGRCRGISGRGAHSGQSRSSRDRPGARCREHGELPLLYRLEVHPWNRPYNIVSDTVTGLNVRKRDNKFQAVFIFGSVLLFATISAVITAFNGQWKLPWYGGALVGAFAGLVIGVLTSGTILMFYRGMRHFQGKHE